MGEHEEKFKFVTEGADKAAKDFEAVAKGSEHVDAANKKTGMSFADLGGAVQVARAAFDAFSAIIGDSIKLYAELDAEQGRIVRNLEQMGENTEDAAAYVEDLNAKMKDNLRFGVGIIQQTESFRKLLDVTKDRALAEKDLALAVDIQADGVTDLAGATAALQKVRMGDAGVLKELGVLTKNQEQALSGIKDETIRTRVAMELLNREFAGAAVRNEGLADRMASTEEKITAIKLATGKAAMALGAAGTGLIDKLILTDTQLKNGKTTLELFAVGLQKVADQSSTAATNFGAFLDEVSLADFAKINLQGGIFTEEGRQAIRGVAGRGVAREREATAGANFIRNVRARNKAKDDEALGFTGPEISTDELIRRAVAEATEPTPTSGPTPSFLGDPEDFEGAMAAIDEVLEHERNALQEQRDWHQWLLDEKRRMKEEERQFEIESRDFLAQVTADTRRIKEEAEQADKDARDARNAARIEDIQLGSDFVATGASVAAGFIQNEKAKLAFDAVAAGARAAVSFALALTPPPVGGPQFFPGAVAQAAAAVSMAAKAGSSVGSVAKKGGSGPPSTPSSPSRPTQSDADMATFGRGSGGVFERSGGRVINVHSTFGPSPEDSRKLVAAIRQEERRQS